ncbi:MAG: MBL fold metallo-hydrolase [bacterium]|nr:MBL fold metallo-hydrolase [bacterium]
MRLTVIGCTGSMSGPASAASCYLLQAEGPGEDGAPRTWSILLDLGPGAFGQLMGVCDPGAVDAVLLSHLHADHMTDMISYHVYRRWHPNGALGPVPVYAPEGGLERVRGVGGDGPEEDYSGEFDFRTIHSGEPFEVGPFQVTPVRVEHPVEAYALRIAGPAEDGGEAVLTYSGDTDACEGLAEAASGADLLLSEAAFVDGRDETRGIHLTGSRAGQVAAAAGATRLVLTHIQPWTDPELVSGPAREAFSGAVDVAVSGASWTL